MAPIPPSGGGGSIDVTPDDVNSAASTFAKQQDQLGDVWSTLASSLHAGMAGNDGGAQKFATKYDPAAKAVWRAFESACIVIGGISTGLVQTANNYLKAEHASTADKKAAYQPYPEPPVADDIYVTGPDQAEGQGHSSVPDWLAKYWPNGDPDALRQAAGAWRTAADGINGVTQTLHGAVESITANNNTKCLQAMQAFWNSLAAPGDRTAILTGLHDACESIAKACDAYAKAIDDARGDLKTALAEAGIAVAVTTVIGILLTPFTLGGSDAGAGAADAAEVAAIAGPVAEEFEATVATEVGESIAADVAVDLESAADAVPDIEAAEADTTDVDSTVDEELNQSEGDTPDEPNTPEQSPTEVEKFEAKNFRNDQTAQRHLRDHGGDFGSQSVADYEQGADNFLREAQENDYPARVDADGRVRIYDPSTNTFGVYDSDGTIVSYYKPSSPTYWERNSPDWGDPVKWK
ncbi:MAG TPA: hypothetical protein VHV49_15045 [Pseudonocardiaceae bacterium]|nr:hypothetical protein [Pseudonocardiaceae bacterium]